MRRQVVYLRLSEKEAKMVKEVTEALGFEKPTEWFRYIIRREWEKMRESKESKDDEGAESK